MAKPGDKVNLFGIPLEITNEQHLLEVTDGTGEHIQAVIRVADDPTLDSAWPELRARVMKLRCRDCRELCWVDPKSSPLPGLAQIVCIHCLLARTKAEQEKENNADGH